MIKKCATLVLLLVFGGTGQSFAVTQKKLEPLLEHGLSAVLITKIIDQFHYKKSMLNDEESEKIFEEFLKTLDPNHNVFTKKDIDQLSQFRLTLDDALLKGDLNPAFIMFRKFNERRIERANYALKRLDEKFDFSVKETFLFDREDVAWPADEKALNEIWRKKVKNDYLTLLLADKNESELKETLRKRYKRTIKRSQQLKSEDAYEFFVNAYLRNLEPHTAYFSPRTSENFNINMSLSLEGIGAALQTVDEHTVVKRIIKGGPADLGRLLNEGDKIIGVGQGQAEVEDVIGWRLDDVVQKIRGPKDSIVQLHILPQDSGPGGSDKYITIVRNKIKLEDQRVKKSVLEIPDGATSKKIGVIEIPTFYMDFAAASRGEKDYSSTTRDSKKIIDELRAEKVDGIVIDLRNNGGGSLAEAVSLTGLFIESGPVVQIRKSSGEIQLDEDVDKSIAYSGPLAVLVDRYSASASEIFSGAIQDYGRGTIVGEPTFGKGTVQRIVNLNNYVKSKDSHLGQLKITMAQFFRVNGDSTQHRGVVPDIIYSTSVENDDQGESSLPNALPWAHVPAAHFKPSSQVPRDLTDAKVRHEERVKHDVGFNFLLSQAKLRQKIFSEKSLSLLESKRKGERLQRKKDRNELLNKFRVSRGIKTVSLTEDVADDTAEDAEVNEKLSSELRQVLLREAATILVDISRVPGDNKLSQNDTLKITSN
ncbi:MAG: carboxy terminal-processing peptidase [Gammaproteobacteria bacterium]|nr:carboxy terminal-processing peptidase [Gammaproteobacteria bacterium]